MSFFFRPKKKKHAANLVSEVPEKVVSPLNRTGSAYDGWGGFLDEDEQDTIESPEDIRPSTRTSRAISKPELPNHIGNNTFPNIPNNNEIPWDIEEFGDCESSDGDYLDDDDDDDDNDDADDDDDDFELNALDEQDRQRAMGMTPSQLRAILPQEEGTVWRISGQRLEKMNEFSKPRLGIFESGEVYLCALPTHSFLQLHLWIGRKAHRDKIGLGCVRAVQMRAALALLSMTGGKEVTIQHRQGYESPAFLIPFGGSIQVVERPRSRRRLLHPLPIDVHPQIIVYRVMAKDHSKEFLPNVHIRRLRPFRPTQQEEEEIEQNEAAEATLSMVEQTVAHIEKQMADRASTRRGSVHNAIEHTMHSKHHFIEHGEAEEAGRLLLKEKENMHEEVWQWLTNLLEVNRDTNTCLIILTSEPRRLHQLLHGHKQFSVEALSTRLERCSDALEEVVSELSRTDKEIAVSEAQLTRARAMEADLDTANPLLDAAAQAVCALHNQHINLVKAMKKPPKSVLTVLEVICRVMQLTDDSKKKEKKRTSTFNTKKAETQDWLELSKKHFLSHSGLAVFYQFEQSNIDHARIVRLIEPFLELPHFQPSAVAKTSKVAGALCVWARELYRYSVVFLDATAKEIMTEESQNNLLLIGQQKECQVEKLQGLQSKRQRLFRRHEMACQLRDSLATQRHTLTVWMGSKKEGSGLGGEVLISDHASTALVSKTPGGLSRVASCINALGSSVTKGSTNRTRRRAAVFTAACAVSGSSSLQGTVAASGSVGHHRLHTEEDMESSDDDDDDDDEDEGDTEAFRVGPTMAIVDGQILAMEISVKESDEGFVELVCDRAEARLAESVKQLHHESAYIFIAPSHAQYSFQGKGAVTDVEIYLWMGSRAPLAARMGARRSVRVLAEWAVDSLGAQVDQLLGLEEQEVEDGEGSDADSEDDYIGSVVSAPSDISTIDLSLDLTITTKAEVVDHQDPEHLDMPPMAKTKSGREVSMLKKKASVRWNESVKDNESKKASLTRNGSERSIPRSHKTLKAHKLEHSSSIANLLTFIEQTVGVAETPTLRTGASYKSAVTSVAEGNESEEDDDSLDDIRSLRGSSQSMFSVGDDAAAIWDETVTVCGTNAQLRLNFHTVADGFEGFDFKCYFANQGTRLMSDKDRMENLRDRKIGVCGAATSPEALSQTLEQRRKLLRDERRSLWLQKVHITKKARDNETSPEMQVLDVVGKKEENRFKMLMEVAMNEVRRISLDALLRCVDNEEEEEEDEEEVKEDIGSYNSGDEEGELTHLALGATQVNHSDDDDEEEDDVEVCPKGLVTDELLSEEGDEGLEGLKGDAGNGELLSWRLGADGTLCPVAASDIGMLESHFVYVFFYASSVKEPSESAEEEEVHFVSYVWHGARAPSHQALEWEVNVKPIFIEEVWEQLTQPLRPIPRLVAIQQGKEPSHFRRIFESGGRSQFVVYSSALTRCLGPITRLITFRVREIDSGFISITQVPSCISAFISTDVLVVIKDIGVDDEFDEDGQMTAEETNEVWFWVGAESNDEARRTAALSVSVILEYMGLSESLAQRAQVVSEETLLEEAFGEAVQASSDVQDGETKGKSASEERWRRLLGVMATQGAATAHQWWQQRLELKQRQRIVTTGESEWNNSSVDTVWASSCQTARLYAVAYNPQSNRKSFPTTESVTSRRCTGSLGERLQKALDNSEAVSSYQKRKEVFYSMKRVPFFLFSDLECTSHGAMVDSPIGIFACDPEEVSSEASALLHKVVLERALERSRITAAILNGVELPAESSSLQCSQNEKKKNMLPQCPVFWLRRNQHTDKMAIEKFKNYFQEFEGVSPSPEYWKGLKLPSKSTFLFGGIKLETAHDQWYHAVTANHRTCLRRGSISLSALETKEFIRPKLDIDQLVMADSDQNMVSKSAKITRRNSVLNSQSLYSLSAASSNITHTRRMSASANRKLSINALPSSPSSPSRPKMYGSKSSSAFNLTGGVVESTHKKERRASLQNSDLSSLISFGGMIHPSGAHLMSLHVVNPPVPPAAVPITAPAQPGRRRSLLGGLFGIGTHHSFKVSMN